MGPCEICYGDAHNPNSRQELGDLQLVMKASALLAGLYAGKGQAIEAHEAHGTGLEAAAEAASRLQDLDAILATQAALKEWRQKSNEMPMSPMPPAAGTDVQGSRDAEFPAAQVASPSLDMQDTPIRASLPNQVRRGEDQDVGGRPSRLPRPIAGGVGGYDPQGNSAASRRGSGRSPSLSTGPVQRNDGLQK